MGSIFVIIKYKNTIHITFFLLLSPLWFLPCPNYVYVRLFYKYYSRQAIFLRHYRRYFR